MTKSLRKICVRIADRTHHHLNASWTAHSAGLAGPAVMDLEIYGKIRLSATVRQFSDDVFAQIENYRNFPKFSDRQV